MQDPGAFEFMQEVDAATALRDAARRARAIAPHRTARRIVLIEHRRLVREALRLVLELRSGGEARVVGEAASTADGLDLCLAHRPDIAIVDAEAPGPTAIDLAAALRAARSPTRLILLGPPAPWLDAALDAGGGGAGIHASVTIGDDPRALIEAVKSVAEGRTYLSPVARAHRAESRQAPLFPKEPGPRIDALSPRELEVLVQLARGLSIKQVAALLRLSAKTVDNHAQHLMAKLDVHTRAELVRLAIREQLLTA